MALYRYIELAEHVLRDVPASERNVVIISTGGTTKHVAALQRGNYVGDVYWDTPDDRSIFNTWRLLSPKPDFHDVSTKRETAETLGIMFQGDRIVVAGSRGCATAEGPTYIRAYEYTEKPKQDAFPENRDPQNMLKKVEVRPEERAAIHAFLDQADR
jgi:hypothetical protein